MTGTRPKGTRPNRKREILDTFARLVAQRGYDSVSIREVADQLGMSKGTVLHHYGSKDRMLEQLHHEYMDRRLAEARSILERLKTPEEQLVGMVLQNLFAMHHDHYATVAFAREIVRFASEDTMAAVRGMRREYQHIMTDILARGMRSGAFYKGDPSMIALQIFGMINWSWTWMNIDGPWTLERVGESYVQLVINGVDSNNSGQVLDALPEIMRLVGEAIDASALELAEAAG